MRKTPPDGTDIHWGFIWIVVAVLIGLFGFALPAMTGHAPEPPKVHH